MGTCVNCFAEGKPCRKGCCKISYRIFDSNQKDTDGDAPYLGQIGLAEEPAESTNEPLSSEIIELFADTDAFEVDFPKEATAAQKGALIGTSIFLNALFFEGDQD
jgi:hypothetical protein